MKESSILIAGAAGQGIQTIGTLLSRVCHDSGLYVFSTDDFESRIRGGHSFHQLRISSRPLSAPDRHIDILVAVNERDYALHKGRLRKNAVVLINADGNKPGGKQETSPEHRVFYFPFDEAARACGGLIASNTVAAGAVLAVMGAGFEKLEKVLTESFRDKPPDVLELNLAAGRKGYEMGRSAGLPGMFDFEGGFGHHTIMGGSRAAALGALAADCRFFSFYPMSPGTGIISQAARYAGELPIVVEQAEDELAAINMAIGASFAGVRSLVSTSGGGFCLMTEGLGLSAMTETPVVIILAQRPGPATGLATRTAQADLLFSITASQDEFPRFVFAPGSVLETFRTVKRAFFLSEKYQVPAIVLMDQFLADSARTESEPFDLGFEHQSFLDQDTELSQGQVYRRYRQTDTGVSPRRVPCASGALVRASGNEHNEEGLSSEDPANRIRMMDKRMQKTGFMKAEMRMPDVFSKDSEVFITGWGSTRGSIMEACLCLREAGIDAGWVIFEDIWPLDARRLKKTLENRKLIMVEANATCQMGSLIRQLTGLDYQSSILKYDGRPIYPFDIIEKVRQIMGK